VAVVQYTFTQNNAMKQNTQNGTYITLRIHARYLYKIKEKHAKHATIYAIVQKRTKTI
jgi:hypothetical protein